MGRFESNRLTECLADQANFCERIAAACWGEELAQKFRRFAAECRESAAKEWTAPTQAQWPDSPGSHS